MIKELIGMEAWEAYPRLLLQYPDVREVTLFEYDPPLRLQDRVGLSDTDRELVDRANRMRVGTGISFWDSVFATCSLEGRCTDLIAGAAFFHNGQGAPLQITREEITGGAIRAIVTESKHTVALGSRLFGYHGSLGHINVLDLRCKVSPPNQSIVRRLCRHLMPDGFIILDSGGSYHASSVTVGSDEDRINMLARAILASPIADARYAAHQLLQNSSSIRISRGGDAGKVPIVVDYWMP